MKSIMTLIALGMLLTGCSSMKDKQDVDKKVAEETVTDGAGLGQSFQDLLRNSKNLTDKQKEQLTVLFNDTKAQNKLLLAESFKLKTVLVKELLSEDNNASEVSILKKQIKKNEALRLKTSLNAIEQMSQIMGKSPETNMYANQILLMDHIR